MLLLFTIQIQLNSFRKEEENISINLMNGELNEENDERGVELCLEVEWELVWK